MKPLGSCTRSRRFSCFARRRWHRPRSAVLSLMMLGLSIGISNAQTTTTSQPREHVYLLRGAFNVFSLGMDQIAAKLQQRGIHATVDNYLAWPQSGPFPTRTHSRNREADKRAHEAAKCLLSGRCWCQSIVRAATATAPRNAVDANAERNTKTGATGCSSPSPSSVLPLMEPFRPLTSQSLSTAVILASY